MSSEAHRSHAVKIEQDTKVVIQAQRCMEAPVLGSLQGELN